MIDPKLVIAKSVKLAISRRKHIHARMNAAMGDHRISSERLKATALGCATEEVELFKSTLEMIASQGVNQHPDIFPIVQALERAEIAVEMLT